MKIIVDLAGGFGNQLFCYGFGYALSKYKKVEFAIDTSMQDNGIARELEILKLNVRFDQRISYVYKSGIIDRVVFNKIRKINAVGFKTKLYSEKAPTVYDPCVLNITRDTYYKGNWQSEKYFIKYRKELLDILTPKEERSISVRRICAEMQQSNSVAVHIRRGDYVEIGCQLNMEYYNKAICMMKSMITEGKVVFYIFSDDMDFCKNYFAELGNAVAGSIEFRYPKYTSDDYTLDDLLLMSNCHHMIMANSSYSWWAAWLNKYEDKIVICPELGMWKGDFYPDNWVKIKCENKDGV